MKRKPLWRISVATTLEADEAVAEFLGTALNRLAASYFNSETGVSAVTVFCEQKPPKKILKKISVGLQRIKNCGLKIGSGKIIIAKVRREDWAESWKRHFKPIEIGGALLVKPSWSKRQPRKNQSVVVLDPGLSFGTGQHPTTMFCLCEVVRCRKAETHQSFLDIGTGSGILAIAAAKLGYKPVLAFDFDPEAVRMARANARANGVLKKRKITRGDVTKLSTKPKAQFNLVCANLISNLLIAERGKIVAQLKRNGTLVLAGILRTEFPEVQRAFENLELELVSCRIVKEWRSGSFCFR
ncbi:MAG: 50S ribosomal protein L11 methyltransferase [Verrucomicrobiota bacterium]|jgi:ribosomal protein L11 methyltransferase